MIALDTSAIVAIALAEAEAPTMSARMSVASAIIIGTPTRLEAHMVLTGRVGPIAAQRALALILDNPQIRVVDFGAAHLTAATGAFDRFGKGRHPASLNFGDCMSYAVAAVAGCPLLYKGQDFALTDIRSAL